MELWQTPNKYGFERCGQGFFSKSLAIIGQELHLPPGGASDSPRPEQ
jgi:hypothetical protein